MNITFIYSYCADCLIIKISRNIFVKYQMSNIFDICSKELISEECTEK